VESCAFRHTMELVQLAWQCCASCAVSSSLLHCTPTCPTNGVTDTCMRFLWVAVMRWWRLGSGDPAPFRGVVASVPAGRGRRATKCCYACHPNHPRTAVDKSAMPNTELLAACSCRGPTGRSRALLFVRRRHSRT